MQAFAACRLRIGLIGILGMAALAIDSQAQTPASTGATASGGGAPVLRADPTELGLEVPDVEPVAGGDRRVMVKTDDDELVVAKVYVEMGSRLLVILPDGRIQSVEKSAATETDRPFVGVTAAELSAKLAKKFPGFQVKSTKHFVYVYNTSPLFFTGTNLILESLYPGLFNLCKQRKLDVADPPYPLVVVMFRTRKEWSDYMHGMFGDTSVAAFYHGVTNRVMMYEQSELGVQAPELEQKEIITTVAHEGTHQILHNIGVQRRLSRWPMWISEGLPEYFSPTTVGKTMRWKGVGTVNDLRMMAIDRMLKNGSRGDGKYGSTVEAVISTPDFESDGYAWSWALTHFLGEKKREPFYKYVAAVSKLGPFEKLNDTEQRLLFAEYFGGDFDKLSTDLIAHLKKLPYVDPIENMTHYVVMLTYPVGGGVSRSYTVTASPTEVEQIRQRMLLRLPPDVQREARFEVRPLPTRSGATTFADRWLQQ